MSRNHSPLPIQMTVYGERKKKIQKQDIKKVDPKDKKSKLRGRDLNQKDEEEEEQTRSTNRKLVLRSPTDNLLGLLNFRQAC